MRSQALPSTPRLNRRNLLLGAGALAAAGAVGGWRWWNGYGNLQAADRAATSLNAQFEQGLIGIERSGWTRPEGLAAAWPVLSGDIDCDVVVVGGGLAGTSLALHLAEAGVAVALIEARQPGWGASGRNAGHVLPILRDRSVFDAFPDQGRAFLDAFREHRGLPFALAERLGVGADVVRSGYLNVAESREAMEKFRAQTAWMEQAGLLKVAETGGEDLYKRTGSHLWTHALDFVEGGRTNPYRLTNAMAAGAAAKAKTTGSKAGTKPAEAGA